MRRVAGYVAVSLVLALAGVWVVAQIDLTSFQSGEVISSAQMNANFQELADAVVAKQERVQGTCPVGSAIREVAEDGSVVCEPVAEGGGGGAGSVTAGAGLVLNGSEISIEVPLDLGGDSNSTPTLTASNASTGGAVRGESGTGTFGTLGFEDYGVFAQHAGGAVGRLGNFDYGVYGFQGPFSSRGYLGGDDTGAFGATSFQNGRGVYGYVDHPSGATNGVFGTSESSSGTGARGVATADSGQTYGVYGETRSASGYAVWGDNVETGSFGYMGGDWAVAGRHGNNISVGALGTPDAGVRGQGNFGALAGDFIGNVRIDGNLNLTGTLNPPSSRSLKRDIVAVDPRNVLRDLAQVPMATWRYAGDEAGATHLGPMAEDFHAVFGLGADPARIATIDADGVALAAIQGLVLALEERDARIRGLEERLAVLEARTADAAR
ncbi:MAG: hypothetical protein GVY27_06610 [Deinococcus-Thermus bacterium]|jgi:hypothetical protein|nr:hypothetical protein [Deinococcota bacterium]